MCGRFCCSLDSDTIRTRLYEDDVIQDRNIEWIDQEKHRPSYNVCPTRWVPGILEKGREKTKCLQSMQWGYIPSWAKSPPQNKPINARSETLTEHGRNIFGNSANSQRCIIAAEGFYEWNKKRQVFYVKRKDGQLMLFAGLYGISNMNNEKITTCTIITTVASKFFSKIHNRIPVILNPEDADKWIDNSTPFNPEVIKLLKPFEGALDCYQVTDKVGPTKNDSPDLNKPIDEQKSSISQFLQPISDVPKIKHKEDTKQVKCSDIAVRTGIKRKMPPATNKNGQKSKTPKITNFFMKK